MKRASYKGSSAKLPSYLKKRRDRFKEAYYTYCPGCQNVTSFNREKRCTSCNFLDKSFREWRN